MAFMDETGLAELWSLVRNADVKIEKGSYVGTGVYAKNPMLTLTFGFTPKIVIIQRQNYSVFGYYGDSSIVPACWFLAVNGTASIRAVGGWYDGVVNLSWSGNNLSLTPTNTNSEESANKSQLNISGETYNYIAIG